MGNLLSILVHSASIHDTKSGITLVERLYQKFPTLKAFCADGGYQKTTVDFVQNELDSKIYISKKIDKPGFNVLPKRWIVERTFAWINNSRRLAKDYEIRAYIEANMVRLSMLKLTLIKCSY
jgi:putative transposase